MKSVLAQVGTLVILFLSMAGLLFAPLLMPQDYDWVSNAISEAAAQGIHGAWLARLGFVLYGMAVIWLTASQRGVWSLAARGCHLLFGVFMVCAAAFSIRPWAEAAPFDPTEDFLHSFAATAMGFAYTLGVLLVFLQRPKTEFRWRMFDLVAAVVATVFPLMMLALPEIHGLIQRTMFLVSYLWYGKEALRLARAGTNPVTA
jgi:hypothetical protein